jgi:hypothetical protein
MLAYCDLRAARTCERERERESSTQVECRRGNPMYSLRGRMFHHGRRDEEAGMRSSPWSSVLQGKSQASCSIFNN